MKTVFPVYEPMPYERPIADKKAAPFKKRIALWGKISFALFPLRNNEIKNQWKKGCTIFFIENICIYCALTAII